MVMTRRGVYHNLYETEYAASNGEVAFFFSSRFYLEKFLHEYAEHRIQFQERLSKAMIADEINSSRLADLYLYKSIEKRGFRVVNLQPTAFLKKGDLKWQESHQYALWNVTNSNTANWLEMPKARLDEHRKSLE